MKKHSILAAMIAFLVCGCESDKNDFEFSIEATPSRLHAPSNVTFELNRSDGQSVESCRGSWDFGDGVQMSGDVAATHEYRDAGTYTVSVDLKCDGDKSASRTSVEVYAPVDLSVSSVEVRPTDVNTNASMKVSFQVANGAGEALKIPTFIDVYLSTQASTSLDSNATRIYRYTLPSIGSASSQDAVQKLEFDIPIEASVRTGVYYVVIVVNPNEDIGESSYENNAAYGAQSITVRNQTTDGADLYAKRLQVTPATTSILSAATAQFEIINQGATTSTEFVYEIWMGAKDNATDMNGATKVHESTVSGGLSGVEQAFNNIAFSVSPAVTEKGLYYFWLLLDTGDVLIERDETNNTVRSSSPIQVTNETLLDADITVESVQFTPSSTNPGGTFSATIDLFNQGAQPTGSFVCTVFLSDDMSLDIAEDSVVGSINVDNLPAVESKRFTAIMETDTGIKAGKYWVYAFCDSTGVVAEANEDNNIQRAETQLSVLGSSDIDLVLGPTQLETDATLEDGDTLNVSVILCNNGTSSAGPHYVSVMRQNLCTSVSEEYARLYVEGVEANACTTVYSTSPHVCDFWCPSYAFSFVADSTQIVSETDETNNTSSTTATVQMSGDSCVCSGDRFEPNDVQTKAAKLSSIDEALTLCADDIDFFQIDVGVGENYELKLSHDNALSPLQIYLYRGTEWQKSVYGSDNLYLSDFLVQNVDESPVYVRISGLYADSANRYHLNLETYGSSEGIDLAVSNVEISGGALNASDYHAVSASLSNVGTEAAGAFYVGYYLSTSPEFDGNASLLVRQKIAGLAAGDSTVISASLKLPADTAGGKYYVLLKADDEGTLSEARQSNNLARSESWTFARACWDVLDPNDAIDDARVLDFQDGRIHYDDLAVCQDNRDFYAFHVEDNSAIDIRVTGTGSGDFDIVLYDSHGNEIDSSKTGSATETIHRDVVVGDQWLYLEVFLLENVYNAQETAYSLDIEVSQASSWYACSAAFEPNDFPTSAYDMKTAMNSGTWAELCPSQDEDYYVRSMVAGDRLQVKIESEATGLRAALYEGTALNFLQMITNVQTQSFDYTALQDGDYLIRVFTNVSSAPTMAYRLVNAASDGPDLAVSGGRISPATLQSGDLVTIAFTVSQEGTTQVAYQVELTLETPSHTYALDSLEGTLEAGAQREFVRKVELPDDFVGMATIVVEGKTDGDVAPDNNRLSFEVVVDQACLNDVYEPNDNILVATELTTASEGVLCPGDVDWYKVASTTATTAELTFLNGDGDLELFAYDASGHEVARSTTSDDRESVTLEDVLYLEVKGVDSGVQNSYRLELVTP